MKLPQRVHTGAPIVVGSMALVLLTAPAFAQNEPVSAPPARPAAKLDWKDCAKIVDAGALAALAKARALMQQTWIETPRGYFAAYTMPGEKRNPFDLSPRTPESGPRHGTVQARTPACVYAGTAPAGALTVRFVSLFYRFHEVEAGWSPPLRNGVMMEVALEPVGEDWKVKDTASQAAVLLPEQKPRRADAASLPPETKWAEPIPGCVKGTRWNGADCIKRKR